MERVLDAAREGRVRITPLESFSPSILPFLEEKAVPLGIAQGKDAVLREAKNLNKSRPTKNAGQAAPLIQFVTRLDESSLLYEDLRRWYAPHGAKRITNINDTTRNEVRREVTRWLLGNEDISVLSEKLRQFAFSPVRAEMIAVTEVTDAVVGSRLESWRVMNDLAGSPIIFGYEWSTANDERVCPICGPLGGVFFYQGSSVPTDIETQRDTAERVPFGQPFVHPGGGPGLDQYAGQQYERPPAHPRCRCTLIPVLQEDQFGYHPPRPALEEWVPPTWTEINQEARRRGYETPDELIARLKQRIKNRRVKINQELEEAHTAWREMYKEAWAIQDRILFEEDLSPDLRKELQDRMDAIFARIKELENRKEQLKMQLKQLLSPDDFLFLDDHLVLSTKGQTFAKNRKWFKEVLKDFERMLDPERYAELADQTPRFKTTWTRAYYSGHSNLIVSQPTEWGKNTTIHELGHWLEAHDEGVHNFLVNFLKERTKGDVPQLLSELTGDSSYGPEEIALKDKFFSPYIGKIYCSRENPCATEVLSMAVQYLYQDPAYLLEKDPELFKVGYAVLRGLIPPAIPK